MVTKQEVVDELKKVIDPHVGIDVHTMGLIQDIEIENDEVRVTFVPSSPFCPMGVQLATAIKTAVQNLEGVKAVVTVKGHVQEEDINKSLKEC